MSTSHLDSWLLASVAGFRPEKIEDFKDAVKALDKVIGDKPPEMLITIASRDPLLVREAHKFFNESKQRPDTSELLVTLLRDAWKEDICKRIAEKSPVVWTIPFAGEQVQVQVPQVEKKAPPPRPEVEVIPDDDDNQDEDEDEDEDEEEDEEEDPKEANGETPKTKKTPKKKGTNPIDPNTKKPKRGRPKKNKKPSDEGEPEKNLRSSA